MNVGIPIIATGRYFPMVAPLVGSIRQFWQVGSATPIILTDSDEPLPEGCTRLKVEHRPWPHPTLKRWHMMLMHRQILSAYDFLLHMDVDMRLVAPVTNDVLGRSVGVLSPVGYDWEKDRLPFERNPKSAAYVPMGTGDRYYCGSINGGRPDHFFQMACAIVDGVDADLETGFVARYHEESHLNRWYVDNPPDVTLTPEYCYPERLTLLPRYKRRIILTLDHPELDAIKR